MRILWLNSGLLIPLDKGGKLRSWHLLRHLAERHEVTYLGFSAPSNTPRDFAGMLEACADLQTVARRDPAKGTAAFYFDAARHLTDRLPYAAAKYRSAEYRSRLDVLLETGRFDAVICDFLVPAVNMPRRLPCPAVLFTHNVEAEIWRRHAETETRLLQRRLLRAQFRRMLRFEGETLGRFDAVLAVSETDRQTFERLYGADHLPPMLVIPTGVDTRYFVHDPAVVPDPFRLVFTGSMDWLPNEDAVLHFCRDILPLLRRAEPRVALTIVGRNPTPAVRRLAEDPGIEVTGRVDDVRPHIARASAYVVPIRIGGGTRLKIFEAMSMGKAVVSTTVGAEGLPVTPGNDILIEDPPDRFAAAVVDLLRNDVRRASLGHRARALVVGRYDWSAVARDLEEALLSLAGRPGYARTAGAPERQS